MRSAAAAGALLVLAAAATPARAAAQCADPLVQDELDARRRYRGVVERVFRKAGRHEVSAMGGLYAADLFSSSWLVQGAYTYHPTEELGLEVSYAYTRSPAEAVDILEDERNVTLLSGPDDVHVVQAHLLWSVAYGKIRWSGGGISRLDLVVAIGGGFTDAPSSRGLTLSLGLGAKIAVTEWLALRLDVRDQLLQQELLGASRIVQNLAATLGLSFFFPFEA